MTVNPRGRFQGHPFIVALAEITAVLLLFLAIPGTASAAPSFSLGITASQLNDLNRKVNIAEAMVSALKANPQSVLLLVDYARAFNEVIVAQEALTTVSKNLKVNRTAVKIAQSALTSATAGGQSDMNRELGALRSKLRQATDRVVQDKIVLEIAQSNASTAQLHLVNAEAAVAGDPLASVAVSRAKNVRAKGAPPRKLSVQPLGWSWR